MASSLVFFLYTNILLSSKSMNLKLQNFHSIDCILKVLDFLSTFFFPLGLGWGKGALTIANVVLVMLAKKSLLYLLLA